MAARKVPTEYDILPTVVAAAELRVLAGAKPDVPKEVVRVLYNLALQYAEAKQAVDQGKKQLETLREKILPLVDAFDGLRGIRCLPQNFSLLAVRKEEVSWDRDLLMGSLGAAYAALVREELMATVAIPLGAAAVEQIIAGFREFLGSLGIPAEDIGKILGTEVELKVDTEKLEVLVDQGEVNLLPGAKEVTGDWAIELKPLMESQRVKAEKKSGARRASRKV